MSYTPPPGSGGYGPQGGYQQPAYGGGYGGTSDHPQGTTILVLGILSLVVCQLLGPFAWVMGNKAIKEIDAGGGRYGNRGQVQAGRICGAIATALMVLGIGLFVILLIAGAASSSS